MSTQTMASHRAYQLATAVMIMAQRLASAERDAAMHSTLYAVYKNEEDRTEHGRWARAGQRRQRGLERLTAALRDLPTKEGAK